MFVRSFLSALAASTALVSCTVGPDYKSPEIQLPARYVDGSSQVLSDASRTMWWTALGDPLLNEIVMTGLRQNLDVQASVQRIETARAALGRTGIAAQSAGGISLDQRRIQAPNGTISEPYGATADAIFFLDLFGEFTRGRQGATANLESVQFDSGAVRLAYTAEVIDAYNSARFFQASASITRSSIASRQRTLELVQQRAAADDATALELAQARALLATAQANLPILQGRYQENVFRIATLIAQPSGVVLGQMNRGGRQLRPRGSAAAGLPADVLRNRPDVRQAERDFAAATAAIGVAEAQLLPSLTIDGTITAGSIDTWGWGPALTLPVFNRGVLEANRKVAESRAKEAELIWRSSVLNAIEDTQSAIVLVRQWARQVSAFQRAVSASNEVLDLSQRSYDVGAATLLDVIDAERSVADNRLSLASSIRSWTSRYVQLQVGAGKGWLVGVDKVYVVRRKDGPDTFDF